MQKYAAFRVLVLAAGLPATFLAGCSDADVGPAQEEVLQSTGLALSADLSGVSDVGAIRFSVTPVDCETGLPSGEPIVTERTLEDFTIRAAQAWGAGRKDWDNGAVLFVFVADRKMRIETGYGLEGALPDQLAARILDNEVRPRFRSGDWAGGLEAGIDAIIAATKGEYKAPPPPRKLKAPRIVALVIVLVFVLLLVWLGSQGGPYVSTGRTYSRRGPRRDSSHWGGGGWTSGWGGGGGGSG